MSRRSTASSRGYVGDVSAGSVYATPSRTPSFPAETPTEKRVPRPSGDPTGAGYAAQYAAYVAVATPEQMKGVSPPTSPTGMVEGGLTITVMPAATPPTGGTIYGKKVSSIYTTKESVTPGLYNISGLPVSPEEYYARKAGARAEAYRSGGYQIPTPYTEISYLKKKRTPEEIAEEQRLMQGTVVITGSPFMQKAKRTYYGIKEFITTPSLPWVKSPTYQAIKTEFKKSVWAGVPTEFKAGMYATQQLFPKYPYVYEWGKRGYTEAVTSFFLPETKGELAGTALSFGMGYGFARVSLKSAQLYARMQPAYKPIGRTIGGLAAFGIGYTGGIYAGTTIIKVAESKTSEAGGRIIGRTGRELVFLGLGAKQVTKQITVKRWYEPSKTSYRQIVKTQEARILSLDTKVKGGETVYKGVTTQRFKEITYYKGKQYFPTKYGKEVTKFVLAGEVPKPEQVSLVLKPIYKKGYMKYEVFAIPRKETSITMISKGKIITTPFKEAAIPLGKVRAGEASSLLKISERAGENLVLARMDLKGQLIKYPEIKLEAKGWGLGFEKSLESPSFVKKGKVSFILQDVVQPEVSFVAGKTTGITIGKISAKQTWLTQLGITKLRIEPKVSIKTSFFIYKGDKFPMETPLITKGYYVDIWKGKSVSVPARPPTEYQAKYGKSKGFTFVKYIPAKTYHEIPEPEVIKGEEGFGTTGPFDKLFKEKVWEGGFSKLESLTPQKLAKYQQGMLYNVDYTFPVSRTGFESVQVPVSFTGLSQKEIQQQQQKYTQLLSIKQVTGLVQQQQPKQIQKSIQKLQQKLIQQQSSASAQISSTMQVQKSVLKQVSGTVNTSMNVTVVPVVTPPPPITFPLGIKIFMPGGKGGPFRKPRFKPKYTPSLMAGMFNIRGKQPRTITGLEVRPLPMLKKLRRRK